MCTCMHVYECMCEDMLFCSSFFVLAIMDVCLSVGEEGKGRRGDRSIPEVEPKGGPGQHLDTVTHHGHLVQ